MLPTIGLIVGAYVLVRLLALILPPNPKPHPAVVIAAIVAMALTVIGMLDLVTGALKVDELLKQIPPN